METFEGNQHTSFVSSIKIRGIHLLPPVINDKRRSELLRYKQQAVKLEKRLENCRELKKNLEELLNLQTFSERPISAVTFSDNGHLDALGLGTPGRNSLSARSIKLSHDIVDISEYSPDGIKIIDSEIARNYADLSEGQPQHMSETDTSLNITTDIMVAQPTTNKEGIDHHSVEHTCPVINLSEITKSSSLDDTSQSVSPILSGRPRLIRSNSYTLEAPSPILLAHLEKHGNVEDLNIGEQSCKSHWSSFDNSDIPSYIPLENSEFSSMDTVYNNDIKNEESLKNTDNNIPRIEVTQTDISVQQITVKGNSGNNETMFNLNLSDSNERLVEVLKNIPKEYSKQIIELIEKQCLEQFSKVEAKKQFMDTYTLCSSRSEELKQSEHLDDQFSISRASISPSQSINYSVSASGSLMPTTPCSGLIDLEFQNDTINENEQSKTAEESLKNSEYNFSSRPFLQKSHKELFPQLDGIEQKWAASVICAHVRGYLTRRLLKTERVQNLIETIKDALLCAIQLHNADNIDESDVELHRRLMNQVSAACYAFHDVFFSLPVSEQMSLIALDRQRKIDKAKRPTSAPTPRRPRSNSGKSSRKSLTPMSRSLTKV